MPDQMETQRLLIRRFCAGDADDLYEYLADEETLLYEPYPVFSQPQAEEEAARRADDPSFWAVCQKDSGKLIGNLYFATQQPQQYQTWELGFVFNRQFWGQGYATEAARRMLQYGFAACAAHRVEAWCNPENVRSWRLLERLGMRREGHFLQKAYFHTDAHGRPIWHDAYAYGMLREEWAAV